VICSFQADPSVEGSEKSRFVDDETMTQTCRTELLQMLSVTTTVSHSHRQSSAWWCVLVAALPRWSAGRLSTHRSA